MGIKCNSGGAKGADTIFENKCLEYGLNVNAFSYKTKYHHSPNKVEISDDDYNEGVEKINIANKSLKRKGIGKYMNLLARNWSQVKYSKQIFAVSTLQNETMVSGGTGWAVQMGIDEGKEVYVYDQERLNWFKWSYIQECFVKCESPIIKSDFAGIGTREINENGINEINELFKRSFN